MGAQVPLPLLLTQQLELTPQYQHGESDEGNEGHEGHEGDEGHEKEDSEQDCQGQVCQGCGAAREQGEDLGRLDEVGSVSEQEGKDREQEAECGCQEEVCQLSWTLGQGRREGACGAEDQGFRPDQEGLSILPQGEGVLEQLRLSCEVSGAQTQRSASSRCGAFYACRAHGASTVSGVATDEGTIDGIFNPIVHVSKKK